MNHISFLNFLGEFTKKKKRQRETVEQNQNKTKEKKKVYSQRKDKKNLFLIPSLVMRVRKTSSREKKLKKPRRRHKDS